MKILKVARIYESFLKDDVNVLAKPVSDICSLSISLNKLPSAFELANI